MSKSWEEEDDDECFHDSFDRLVSSSNTSCSCSPYSSEPEEEYDYYPNCSPENFNAFKSGPIPKFPVGVCENYDLWTSQPLSVEERRLHLLRQMGLSRNSSLLRHRPSKTVILSPDHLNPGHKSPSFSRNSSNTLDSSGSRVSVSGIVRSKSHENYNSRQILEIPSENSIGNDYAGAIDAAVNNGNHSSGRESPVSISSSPGRPPKMKTDVDESPVSISSSPGRPPKMKTDVDGTRHGCLSSPMPASKNELDDCLDCDEESGVCMIKNLDTGKEFVVNEVREDGMWEKIKEVGTGRQFTMEEFSSEMSVGTSPIVQELMRRQNVEDRNKEGSDSKAVGSCGSGSKMKRRGSWLRSIKNMASSVAGIKDRRSSDERDTSSDKGGRRSSSATDDSQDVSFHGPERVRVRHYGKTVKELSAMYKSQEIQAHNGSIWTIKFSLDGRYLASAGEDRVVHVWQVVETEKKGDCMFDKFEDGNFNLLFLANGSPEPSSTSPSPHIDSHLEKKKRGRSSASRKSLSVEQMLVPDTLFALTEKPICTFQGHSDDVLDLSWSKSHQLLSSSMDKTVRLWDLSSKCCLNIFSHSDYVTCIQFNPVDDRYFISGSLDAKVRIWSIPDRQVVDWSDLHEMVTAACYTPDGQGALVGSYKGTCRIYNTSENKLQPKNQINLQNKKKKSHQKKITGFQFAPGSTSEVLVTSADSRIRVIDGVDLVHKFKGFRNTHSQISASLASNGKYVISASEDSYVYVWRHDVGSQPNRSKGVSVTQSYELFHCLDVSVAIPWPSMSDQSEVQHSCSGGQNGMVDRFEEDVIANHPTTPVEEANGSESSPLASDRSSSPFNGTLSCATNSYLFDRISRTWSEEKLFSATKNHSPRVSVDYSNGFCQNRSAVGMVIVTAGFRGEIRVFQNFGLPVRI